MNIMLASVLERTREIGIRRALGARRKDILSQFLVESLMVSLTGGAIGVLLGYAIPEIITLYAGWRTIVQPWTIALAFGVSIWGTHWSLKIAQKPVHKRATVHGL